MKKIIRIWDLPIRLFHWALVVFIIISFITVNIGGDAMALHALSGYCILALIIFRIFWGSLDLIMPALLILFRAPGAYINI